MFTFGSKRAKTENKAIEEHLIHILFWLCWFRWFLFGLLLFARERIWALPFLFLWGHWLLRRFWADVLEQLLFRLWNKFSFLKLKWEGRIRSINSQDKANKRAVMKDPPEQRRL